MDSVIKKFSDFSISNYNINEELNKIFFKKIIHNKMENVLNSYVDKSSLKGGEMRQFRGISIENFVIDTINLMRIIFKKNIIAVKGQKDVKKLSLKIKDKILTRKSSNRCTYLS